MRAATRRRRRLAAGLAAGLATAAFAVGASLGDGGGTEPTPSAASLLGPGALAGERIVAGFDGRRPPVALLRMIRAGRLAGVILFADNLGGRAAVRRLTDRLQSVSRPRGLRDPLLIMIDQEGGLVKRLPGPPDYSAAQMGERGAALSRRQGRLAGRSLRAAGINVDLAPVLDVARPGGTIAETDRGFGSDAATVSKAGVAFARGLQAGGAAATAKHFPGLGAAAGNTDFASQRVALGRATLRGVDEAPFRAFAGAGGELVMLSTAVYPPLSGRPAAFSRAIATGELRRRTGFAGVSVTDALDSAAVRSFAGPVGAARAATGAGTDLLLYVDPESAARAQRALARGLRRGALSRAAFEASAGRVLRLRHRLAG